MVINHTRVVYPAQESEVTVGLANKSSAPSLVQVWIDAGDRTSTPESAKVPFAISPPIFRLDPDKGGSVRVVYTKEALPADKESLFFLNVREIPAKSNDGSNMLQFSVRNRIKLFFRPARLPGSAAGAANQLAWKLVDGEAGKGVALQVTNPTPYYVNFSKIGLSVGERSFAATGKGGMVAPGATTVFPMTDLANRPAGDAKAQFNVINDDGSIKAMVQPLAP